MAKIKLFLVSFLTLLSLISDTLAQTNVAIYKKTVQSSTSYSGTSSRAVDGKTNSNYLSGSCTHTDEASTNWWCVDLESEIKLNNIKIYNRDMVGSRLQGLEIRLISNGKCDEEGFQSATICYKDNTTTLQAIYTIDECNQDTSTLFTARSVYISVSRDDNSAVLTLCEVEIFEDCNYCLDGICGTTGGCSGCTDGHYGNNCENTCLSSCTGGCVQSGGVCNGCDSGYYGNYCTNSCSVGCNNGGCVQSGGICNGCDSGFYGDYCTNSCSYGCNTGDCSKSGVCNNGCKEGYWGGGGGCFGECPNCKPGGCRTSDGVCINGCKKGWYGNKCDRQCNQRCSGGCVQSSGVCNRCKLGFYGNYCGNSCNIGCSGGCIKSSGICYACDSGRHGDLCDKYCNVGCSGGCIKYSGICNRCKLGFYGNYCNNSCSVGCNTGGCRTSDGVCINGCKEGWHRNKCNRRCNQRCTGGCVKYNGVCNSCDSGFYGDYCDTRCNVGCLNSQCSQQDGTCSCKPTHYDSKCSSVCSNKCQGRLCYSSSHPPSQPICKSGCVAGYKGSYCQTSCPTNCLVCNESSCSSCKTGWYGTNCLGECSGNCYGGCMISDGKCNQCKSGTVGDFCNSTCGDGCLSAGCDRNGKCTSGCIEGRFGDKCDINCSLTCDGGCDRYTAKCTQCKNGYYGDKCDMNCSLTCDGGCDIYTAKCTQCKNGYYGYKCDMNCSLTCDGGCDRYTAKCTQCKNGYYGDKCDMNCSLTCDGGCDIYTAKCTQCKNGYYGDTCQYNCSMNCIDGICTNGGKCTSGCIDGKSGSSCDSDCKQHCTICKQDDISACAECTDGRFGESCNKTCSSNCKSDQVGTKPVCNITSGMCSLGCQVGFYGDDCNIECNTFCQGNLCDQVSGLCSEGCIPGKIGTNCTEDCTNGLYGFNCTNKCGNCANRNPCNKTSGICGQVGCQEGFEGPTCDSVVKVTSQTTTIIASVVAVVLVIIVVIIVLVVMFIRRRRQPGKELNTNNNNIPLNRHIYENIQPGIPDHHYSTLTERVDNIGAIYANVYDNDAQIYQNVSIQPRSPTCIDLVDLWDYIQGKKERNGFSDEYQKLPKGLCRPHDVCMNEFNKLKNRYKGICAFDDTRVKLELQDGDPNSDYINACYLTTYGTADNKYIASQGPIDVNINEFIRMIWDVDASTIVMVTNLCENSVEKCVKYWPEVGQTTKTGKISIQLIKQDVFANFTIRELKIIKDGCNSRIVKQYHYTSWPDKGVPADITSLLEFRNLVERSATQRTGPMIVHCSAGIGRTGTYLALDYLINEGQSDNSVDVFRCVSQMRRERVNMVQTQVQYVFLHDALTEWYLTVDTISTVTEYQQVYQQLIQVNTQTGKSGLQDKYELMNKMALRTDDNNYSDAHLPHNINKNRDWNILASNTSRPYLQMIDHYSTEYINAVKLPSYRKKNGYILTQTPLPNTVVDFWTLVVQSEANIVINLEHTGTARKDVGEYLPQGNVVNCGPYTITKTTDEKHKSGLFTVITCHITSDVKEDVDNTVRIYQCNFWTDEHKSPQSSHAIFCLLEEINSWSKTKNAGSVVVHCLNGSDKGGFFCVLAAIVERLDVDQDFSVLQKILQFRVQRPQIITCFEQFTFCFQATGEYIDNMSTYANSSCI